MGYLASSLEISQFLLTELHVTFFFLKRALDKNKAAQPHQVKAQGPPIVVEDEAPPPRAPARHPS